jgi:hypothetical protein
MTPQEPFDAQDIEEIAGVDALFDRLGARAPSPDDLDDPVVAALALMAAEIDLDAVPLDTTRAALASARPDFELPSVTFVQHDEPAGLVIDLRDADRAADPYVDAHDAYGDEVDDGLDDGVDEEPPAAVRARSLVGDADEPRRPVRRDRRPEPGATAMAPPRSLPRSRSTRPGPGHPGEGRRHRLRPVTAAVIAVAAFVLGSGVSAALTGGRSVNPLTGIQQVVAVLTGNRTAEQKQAYDAAQQQLRDARAAVRDKQYARAQRQLEAIDLSALSADDAKAVRKQIAEVKASAHG